MLVQRFIFISLTIATLIINVECREREIHRLVGGHLKTINIDNHDDTELLETLSSGARDKNGKKKNESTENTGGGEEEKKTLAQQVADGKYGLIQRELFKKPLKQPGIISYDPNPEIPKDNLNNLGGLTKEDIWLAENHLLVLKGGNYPKHDDKSDQTPIWPAIDNYTAPKRPVKVPLHPKVPPPFPVQLTDDGPLQILGTNSTRTLDGPPPVYALPPPEGGYVPGTGPFFPPYPNPSYPPSGRTSNENSGKTSGEDERGSPFPPSLNGTLPPFFAHLPPGAVAVPPPPSINDFDEDDPSIYYPPPYTFYYPSKDNSSLVPAGPLVPGIILPPPPNFFAPLESPSSTTKRPKIQKTTEPSPQIHPTTTPIPPTSVINITLRKPIKVIPNNPTDINNELKPIITTTIAPTITKIKPSIRPYSFKARPQTKRPAVTILKPVQPKEEHKTYYNQNNGNVRPFPVYGPPSSTTDSPKTLISSTQVPLKHYYTSDDIHSNVVTITPERNTVKPAQYYYYEEEPQTNSISTPQPNKIVKNFFNLPDEYFETPKQVHPPRTKYIYVTSKPYTTPKPRYLIQQSLSQPSENFKFHLSRLKQQIQYYTSSPRPAFREVHSPKPVYQYSFQANNYKSQHHHNFKPSQSDVDEEGFRPMPKYSVQIQPAIELPVAPTDQQLPQNPIYFKQTFRTSTEKPSESQRYYTTIKPNIEMNENTQQHKRGRNLPKTQPIAQYSFDASPDKRYRGYYSPKPNQDYYDENYSTFGQRIPSYTTPSPGGVRYSTRSPKVVYITANSNIQQKPISLESDTLVNYLLPRPNINPDSEFIPINYPQVAKYVPRPIHQYPNNQQHHQQVRFNDRPQIVNAIPIKVSNEDARKGSFISYSLPGDNGAHFYFLTPQLAQRRDQGAGYYYSQTDNERIRRNDELNTDKRR